MTSLFPIRFAIAAALSLAAIHTTSAADAARDDSAAEKLGLHLAMKCYTFISLSFTETVAIAKGLGLKYIEINPSQKFSPEQADKTDHNSSPELRAAIKKQLADAGITAMGFGVVGLGKDEAADRKVFQYCKDLGITVIVSEPASGSFDLLDKLTADYGIKVAMHNHPEPSPYFKPEIVLKTIEDHSKAIGSCADTGHWARSGLVPVDCLKELEGHIISSHFKDTDKIGKGARDVPYGTGKADLKGQLAELVRQKFSGLLSLEYESGAKGDKLIAELKQSIAYFDEQCRELAK